MGTGIYLREATKEFVVWEMFGSMEMKEKWRRK